MKSANKSGFVSPVVSGSGAIVVHRALEAHIPGYRVEVLSPYWSLCPPLLALRGRTWDKTLWGSNCSLMMYDSRALA